MDALAHLSPVERSAVEEEEALLARVSAALERARHGAHAAFREGAGARATEALRVLRDEAMGAREEDLPGLLHEMTVHHRLARRHEERVLPSLASPYIAHLRVDEGSGAEDYCLGRVSFFDADAGVWVVDWRVAPLARIFYHHREGDAYEEEFPGRIAEGTVLARRIVAIENGILTRVIGDGLALEREPDGTWRTTDRDALSLATGGSGTAARRGILGVGVGESGRASRAEVTALLDAEQYAAVDAPPERPLLVLGSAGSGKTTVALHRLAHIAAAEPRRYPAGAAQVVVPEEGLARLASRLLEPLGLPARHVRTIDGWASEVTRRFFRGRARLDFDAPPLVSGLKRHPALYHALSERFPGGRAGGVSAAVDASDEVDDAGRPLSRPERLRRLLAALLSDRSLLEEVVRASGGAIPSTAIDETLRRARLQLEDTSLEDSVVDSERKRAVDDRALREGTPEELAGTIDVEDVPILLFLLLRDGESPSSIAPGISLLVLDESEDFSLFELFVLGNLRRETSSVTVAGDEAQQTFSSFAGWEEALATLGAAGASVCRLHTAYRCPRPVVELARRILGPLAPDEPLRAAREGAPVGIFRFPDEAQAHLFAIGALRDLLDREPRASVAVVAATVATARRFHALLGDLPRVRLVVDGDFTFEPGIDVTDVENVKGLEFDYVIVPDATAAAYPPTDEARRRLHVAVTRASHQLWLAAGGTPSPLIDRA